MDQPMSDRHFHCMTVMFRVRDLIVPRRKILDEVDLRAGQTVLDFACGPGAYIPDTASRVGPEGKLFALDIHPLAIEAVRRIASGRGLKQVETALSDGSGKTNLPGASVDVVLLYDAFHDFEDPERVLAELNRVLRREGILSFSDHHLGDAEIRSRVTEGGWFEFAHQGKRTHTFRPIKRS
jgi:ubiquinone/menaquinone biosynthesis C-methylase UbiE